MGVVATRRICRGERVFQEQPMLVVGEATGGDLAAWDREIRAALELCSEEERRAFWALADSHTDPGEEKSAAGIVRTNGLPVNTALGDFVGVYVTVSRFNHSCIHNVNNSWQAESRMEVLHATRDVEPGEELCITYVDLFQTARERQAELLATFRFRCRCEVCRLDGPALEKSDLRRQRLRQLREALPQSGELCARVVAKMDALIDEELAGSPPAKCCVHQLGFQLAWALGDEQLSRELAGSAWRHSVAAEGAEAWRSRLLQSWAVDPTSADSAPLLSWGDDGLAAT